MSKDANPGELRTLIYIYGYSGSDRDKDGYLTKDWQNVFGENGIKVKWVNLHGSEVWENMAHNLKDPATLTCRYTPRIMPESRIIKHSDYVKYLSLLEENRIPDAEALMFEVISIDNVDEQNEWLEIKVKRYVKAK